MFIKEGGHVSIPSARIDKVIKRLVESGIIKHWLSSLRRRNVVNNVGNSPNGLTLTHMSGAFILLVVGLMISSVFFVIENFVHKGLTCEGISEWNRRFLTVVSNLIDADRHVFIKN